MPEPFRTDDELVSAVLDGEATADERARVAADPVLSARLAEFGAVAEMVGSPVASPSAGARDTAIAAALAERGRRDEVVVALASRRSRGSFLAVAAAVLVVLLAAGFLAGRLGDGDDSASEVASDRDADTSAGSGGPESDAATAADEAAPEAGTDAGAFGEGTPVALGAVSDEAGLRAALAASGALDAFGTEPTTRSTLPDPDPGGDLDAVAGDGEACLVRLEESDPALDGVLVEGTATYAGTPAVVYVFATVDGDTRVEVVTAEACERLVAFPL